MFAKATTTRVAIDFATPSVTLGAKTSYSYYLLNQPASANTCANDVIYFTGDCASTYAGIQNVYVTEVGFKVDGTTYSSANGGVTWNKSAKSFSMNNMTVSEQRGYAVEAYIVTKEHGTITSSNTLYITGLPYNVTPSESLGWTEGSWNVDWKDDYVQLGGVAGSREASATSPKFTGIPETINTTYKVDAYIAAYYYNGIFLKTWRTTTFQLFSDGNKVISQDSGEQNGKNFNLTGNGTMTNNSQIKLQSTYELAGPYVKVYNLQILYR